VADLPAGCHGYQAGLVPRYASPVHAEVRERLLDRLSGSTNMLLPGAYAWLTTVALPATQRGVSGTARVAAFAALLALLSGPLVALSRPRLGRAIGVLLFVALCTLTWALLGPAIGIERLEPVRALLGTVGWILFALGWGSVRETGSIPEEDPNALPGPPLPVRKRLPRGSMAILAVGMAGGLPALYFAWRVTRPDHALLGHAVAVIAAIALVASGARIAVDRAGYRPPSSPAERINAAARPLGALALLLGLGFVWLLLR
jgi:hypothetical protein